MINKTVIINRAVPGSGKTTITNCIVNYLKQNNIKVSVHSTDEYFMVNNRYMFDIEKLSDYHEKNFDTFKKSILDNTDVVICDNTNIAPWQTQPYTNIAREYGYQIIFLTLNPRELEKHIESQKVTPEKPDAHEVNKEVLEMMIKEYFLYDDLLNKNIFIDENKHLHYKWNHKYNKKIATDIEKHFDSDYIIRILPNEYQQAQRLIGKQILKFITDDKEEQCINIDGNININTLEISNAILHNDMKVIKEFLELGCDINIKCNNELTILEFVLLKNNYEIVKEFYKYHNILIKKYLLDNRERTFLLTTYLEDIETMHLLIKKGCNINIKNDDGNTSLHISVKLNNLEQVKLLINNNVHIDVEDSYGNTPLILALKNNNLSIVNCLLEHHIKTRQISSSVINSFYSSITGVEQIEAIKIFLEMIDVNINDKVHFDFFKKCFIKNSSKLDRIIVNLFLDLAINIDRMLDDNNSIIQYARSRLNTYNWFLDKVNERSNNEAYELVKLLSSFTIDKPIKYTTHQWDFGELKQEYVNFDGFMLEVKQQFEKIKNKLKVLSPSLYKKIYTFLIEENPDVNYSWCSKININVGWSSLKGLKEHCNSGQNPFYFILPKSLSYKNGFKTIKITTFEDIINLFKQEIEIRENFKNFSTLFVNQQKKLDKSFMLDLSAAKIGRQFYTDVEKFTNVIDKIFSDMSTRKDYPCIEISTTELNDRSIELRITQIESSSSRSALELIERAQSFGDIFEIKNALKNLCDWSIESSCNDEYFRVNFLHSNNLKDLEILKIKPKGFTHILRFYK